MKNLLQSLAVILMKEFFRLFAGLKIDWKRVIFAGALMTTAGVILQMFLLTDSLDMSSLSRPITNVSDKSLNRISSFNQTISEDRNKRLQLISTDVPIVLANSSLQLNLSVPGMPDTGPIPTGRPRRRKKGGNVDNVSKVLPPPDPPSVPVPYRLQKFISSLTPHEALVYAKKEIAHPPEVIDDPDLYAPVFRNLSVFKRSYELMELILKVYVYHEGSRPIFHVPHLNGIYASEGWFMRFMEGNKQFVTRDPEEAHLFYLPYSMRQLELKLYVPGSHQIKPLAEFLRDYVNMIAGKYPFWNRTHGSDHFLVACHDWGPYTLTQHKELANNTIKALCNADTSEGIFVAGKDVSLPETTIRNPRVPLRNIGGLRVSQRPLLAFFAGYMHGRVRPILLKYWRDKHEDMKIYGPLPSRISRKMSYIHHMKSSKFCICPMGYEVNSPRIIESIYYECVPVIIADNFPLPLSDVLDWSKFSVIVAEKDIPKLREILLAIPMRRYMAMQTNVKMVKRHFLWNRRPVRYDLFHMILHSIWLSRLNQIQIPES
ncbi:probable glycosyltransferase At5g25310 [Argentina anserina]|uniref:probable glycosyltransferase At5g25310 n=1 Tax=Argentina anserina TaxID=57926 RepID=UPI0021764B24|nr:probable glycosyltransferase At5g25310 [Potentilla anserina]XP_050376180.1 probable glycosyltransferase At5g25310 [Potentilla anserina]XP_050376181.1 probable glycosyltransferase At5g25310 [Potentilla anserina]XP_050376182.1 probable glycosyltransferase At5g25310 [Potentilla anserina]XP_050376184.1 probable glycosyltransferase At5g25310 [Potentilla anserina]